ncbi:Septin-domain-containing protein [Hyaloraphidium curvatum]|nr:Septin-domain-containing protein [Hyaloraphidium curvatum]
MASNAFPPDVVGIATLPNQQHQIAYRKGTNFNLMVVGESGSGKTTFINTLFLTLMKEYAVNAQRFQKPFEHTVDIEVLRADIEEKGFACRLTLIDCPGFGDYVNNADCWAPIVDYLEDQHQGYLDAEEQPLRNNIDDMRVHACLYFIQPTGHTLKPLDVRVMKELSTRVNLIPVISKADTITRGDLAAFKARVNDALRVHGIATYECPVDQDDPESKLIDMQCNGARPFALISSDKDVQTPDGRTVKGRKYLWGVAEVENEDHCDFKKLRNLLIRRHMNDLIIQTQEVHYENYRSAKLAQQGRSDDDPVSKLKRDLESKMKEDEVALRKRFTEQVRSEENRFRDWEKRLMSERDRLNKDLEQQHAQVKRLQDEVRGLEK